VAVGRDLVARILGMKVAGEIDDPLEIPVPLSRRGK
jgi:hypothetical protein